MVLPAGAKIWVYAKLKYQDLSPTQAFAQACEFAAEDFTPASFEEHVDSLKTILLANGNKLL